jgi:hypothetical protein
MAEAPINMKAADGEQQQAKNDVAPLVESTSAAIPKETQTAAEDDAANKKRRWTNDPGIFWLTLAGLIVLAIYTYYTRQLVLDAEESSKQQAAQTQESNAINRRALIDVQRAFVFIDSYNWGPTGDFRPDTGWGITLAFENSGNTPTKDLNIEIFCPFSKTLIDDPYQPKLDGATVHTKRVLGPKQKTIGGACVFDTKDLLDVQKGKWLLYIVGKAEYQDVFGESHITEFCDVFYGIDGNLGNSKVSINSFSVQRG